MAAATLASQKINEANILLDNISNLKDVKGASKLQKRIKAEINFLRKALKKGSELKEEHVLCSNLGQLGALYDAASQSPHVVGVLQNFSNQHLEKIVVDVVADNGRQWIKVILRCPKALHLLYVMGGRKGVKPLDEVAEDFLVMANHHPVFYSVPQVVFWFFSGVSESLASDLEELGVSVKGTRIPDEELGVPDFTVDDSDSDCEDLSDESDECSRLPDETYSDKESELDGKRILCSEVKDVDVDKRTMNCSCELSVSVCEADHKSESHHKVKINDNGSSIKKCNSEVSPPSDSSETSLIANDINKQEIKKLNLDVTAIIAYVSATTNGGANFIFADKVLTEQAMWERNNPVKRTLDQYFEGCDLLVCQEAVDHFSEIISTIGGPAEKKRAQDLLTRVTVVPGQDIYKDQIQIGGKVRKLSRLIFGTSQAHRAITVTSNRGFVRSVEQQGIKPVVLYHEPRALTEMKEWAATPLESD